MAWLSLSATPAFIAMAVLNWLSGTPGMQMTAEPDATLFERMDVMYLLMGLFHLAPWLRLVADWGDHQGGADS